MGVAAAVVGVAVALAGRDAPARSDIDASVLVGYPGSVLADEVFRRAESGRYIDTGSFANPTQLIREYHLPNALTRTEFRTWLDRQYPPDGWTLASRFDANRVYYRRVVGSRAHTIEVLVKSDLDEPTVVDYVLTYSISSSAD